MGLFTGNKKPSSMPIEYQFLEVVQERGLDYDMAKQAIKEVRAGGFMSRTALVSTYREMEMKREVVKNRNLYGSNW